LPFARIYRLAEPWAPHALAAQRFTAYDGNLAAVAGDSRLIQRPFTGGPRCASSATTIERWASCPFQYLLVQVLRVQATDRPEDEWTITALAKGSLVHEVVTSGFLAS